ncbi:MAG: patatin-like phospholipase family protein [Planctomycetales bacterium]|nr:patatin-like phospholipase family protein [Planctomycetales bacterium]
MVQRFAPCSIPRIAVACQGGGIHGAFTSGVLDAILECRLRRRKTHAQTGPPFTICGLSGTSAGALNAFAVWYALHSYRRPLCYLEARRALARLWREFSAQTWPEKLANEAGNTGLQLRKLGWPIAPPPVPFIEMVLAAIPYYNRLASLWATSSLYGGGNPRNWRVRAEYYDFDALLACIAPQFDALQSSGLRPPYTTRYPRLLVGAADVMSGEFQAFDSFKEGVSGISFDAIKASGTLPEVSRAQTIGSTAGAGESSRYWDGMFSQNPPIRNFLEQDVPAENKPDEIWVIRINPQSRRLEPSGLAAIEDRKNELAGNLSLNQELDFVCKVNEWLRAGVICNSNYKPIDVYAIAMPDELSDTLDVASKFDRSGDFIAHLRKAGYERGRLFMRLWLNDRRRLTKWMSHGKLAHADAVPSPAALARSLPASADVDGTPTSSARYCDCGAPLPDSPTSSE